MKRGNSATQAIKARLNLAELARRYIELRRVSGRWMAPCPFHQETKPSFSINEEEGFFYCFGCQASGDLFDFYGRMHGLDFRESLEALAEETGVSLEDAPKSNPGAQKAQSFKRRSLRMHEIATAHFTANLMRPEAEACRAYIAKRGLSPEIVKSFELGYSLPGWQDLADALRRAGFAHEEAAEAGLLSKNETGRMYDRFRGRLIFPIKDLAGRAIAFGGRIIADEDQAKYINSSDSTIYKKGDHLYGLYQARRSISQKGRLMLTEGYMDVLTLHQFGYTHACGVLGTAFTPEQVKRISGFSAKVDLLFDGDKPGRKAALRACEMLLPRGVKCRVAILPNGADIDDFLRDGKSGGPAAFDALLEAAPDGLDFCIQTLAREFAPTETLDWAKKFLGQMAQQPELAGFFVGRLARGLNIGEADLRQGLADTARPRLSTLLPAPETPALLDAQTRKENAILDFVARYPHHFKALQEAGGGLILTSPFAAAFWEKMQRFGAQGDDLLPYLDERERDFWIRSRTGEVPPKETEEKELLETIETIQTSIRQNLGGAGAAAALRRAPAGLDPDTEQELLRAIQEHSRENNAEH